MILLGDNNKQIRTHFIRIILSNHPSLVIKATSHKNIHMKEKKKKVSSHLFQVSPP